VVPREPPPLFVEDDWQSQSISKTAAIKQITAKAPHFPFHLLRFASSTQPTPGVLARMVAAGCVEFRSERDETQRKDPLPNVPYDAFK
jgi:hypothetical protein